MTSSDVNSYGAFLASKAQHGAASGFEPAALPDALFPFQRLLVDWAVRQGRAALFADCGMGKSLMELTWAQNVHAHTGRPVLLVTPLAVTFQFEAEAAKFGMDAATSRDGSTPAPVVVTNYERLDRFNPDLFGGVVCDESSAIKAFDGVRRAVVTEFLRKVPYRLLGTATAAPNDYIELGTSSEALGELGHMDMLNRFFTNRQRTSDTKGHWRRHVPPGQYADERGWRFKGHAETPFWRWVSSWARAIRRPSDYGFDDAGFILPALEQRVRTVEVNTAAPGALFDVPAVGMREEREELRRTLSERCEAAAAALADADCAVAWCNLNAESQRLAALIPGAVEVTGSEPVEAKEEKLRAFSAGQIRALVTKPSIGAWGLNWQHCHRMTYFPTHSFESWYQAVRRSWRYGQRHPVTVDVITTTGGANALVNLQRKAAAADVMFDALIEHMTHALRVERGRNFTTEIEVPSWLAA